MFLGTYDFDGDPAELLDAYARLTAVVPVRDADLHVCVVRDDGITIMDACPSREVFEGFAASPDFNGALAAAGLPTPRVTPLGTVQAAHMREAVA
jgi:hypothetical protein